MQVDICYFGMVAEATGKSREAFELASASVRNLKEKLNTQYQKLLTTNYKIAVNHRMVNDDIVLNENDIVAILPPFAGG